MKALVIGAAGFVGGHLVDHLANDRGWKVCATKLPEESIGSSPVTVCDLDILDQQAILHLLDLCMPDFIFHLAAQSSVALSWKNPSLTVDVNIHGVLNILEAVKTWNKKTRLLLIGSSEEYGNAQGTSSIDESAPLYPNNIYAATKVCQNMLGRIYAAAYDMDVIMVRAFNHIGPGQSSAFVVSDFCKQVAEIELKRRSNIINVGNLSAKRDFTDVRDIVRAYSLLIEKGAPGETYNVGSDRAVAIEDVLNTILTFSKVPIEIVVDPQKFRPIETLVMQANTEKLRALTDWSPNIPLETTLSETLSYWKTRLKEND